MLVLWHGARAALLVTAVSLLPDPARAEDRSHCDAGLAALRSGNNQRAIDSYDRCLKEGQLSGPMKAVAFYNRGLANDAAGHFDQAILDFGQAIVADPRDVDSYISRGQALLHKGEHALALKDAERAVAVAPENPDTQNNIAWILATAADGKLRDGARALAAAQKAVALADEDASRLDTLAAAYAESGQFTEAVATEQRAIQLTPAADRAALEARLALYQQHKPYRE
jgi:tetratricopeptide (TPR) repeat protein